MTDENSTETPITTEPVADPNNEPVVFINEVLGVGNINGVINVTVGQWRFTPTSTLKGVLPDRIVCGRWRLDLYCAQVLRDQLDMQIAAMTKPKNVAEN